MTTPTPNIQELAERMASTIRELVPGIDTIYFIKRELSTFAEAIKREEQEKFDYVFEDPLIEAPILRADNTGVEFTKGFEAAKKAIRSTYVRVTAPPEEERNRRMGQLSCSCGRDEFLSELLKERSELATLHAYIKKLEDALEEIAKGKGTWSRDPLTFRDNVIDNMKSVAREALQSKPQSSTSKQEQ